MRKNYFVNTRPKLASKILASNTHLEQSVKYEVSIFERKEVCDEKLESVFSSLRSNKSPGYDGISSKVTMSVSEEIFSVLKHMLNLLINQGVFPENMKIACVFKRDDE